MQWEGRDAPPAWVAVDLDGVRARLSRHSDEWRMLLGAVGVGGIGVSVLTLAFMALIGLIVGQAAAWLLIPFLLLTVVILATAVGLRRLYRDHVVKVTEHLFRWNDLRDQFWELPLGAFSGADVEGGVLVLYRHRSDPLRLRAAGVPPDELRGFARTLESLIQTAQRIEAPPEALQRIRGGAQSGSSDADHHSVRGDRAAERQGS